MQNHMTLIAYPTIPEEEKRWGFDVWRPEGMPMAWVLDWKAAKIGWGLADERVNIT